MKIHSLQILSKRVHAVGKGGEPVRLIVKVLPSALPFIFQKCPEFLRHTANSRR
jgi:hypothetical protein